MSAARGTHPRLYEQLDGVRTSHGDKFAAKLDHYVHLVLGLSEIASYAPGIREVHTISDALLTKVALMMSLDKVKEEVFTVCFKAAVADLEEFEAKFIDDDTSGVSTDTKH